MSIREIGRRARRILFFGWEPEEIRYACGCLYRPRATTGCTRCGGRGFVTDYVWTKEVRLSAAERARVEQARGG